MRPNFKISLLRAFAKVREHSLLENKVPFRRSDHIFKMFYSGFAKFGDTEHTLLKLCEIWRPRILRTPRVVESSARTSIGVTHLAPGEIFQVRFLFVRFPLIHCQFPVSIRARFFIQFSSHAHLFYFHSYPHLNPPYYQAPENPSPSLNIFID